MALLDPDGDDRYRYLAGADASLRALIAVGTGVALSYIAQRAHMGTKLFTLPLRRCS
jgi:hypothetical protein